MGVEVVELDLVDSGFVLERGGSNSKNHSPYVVDQVMTTMEFVNECRVIDMVWPAIAFV